MTNIRDVKLATNAVKKLFPPIRDLCQLLKKHHVNHDGLSELDQAACDKTLSAASLDYMCTWHVLGTQQMG